MFKMGLAKILEDSTNNIFLKKEHVYDRFIFDIEKLLLLKEQIIAKSCFRQKLAKRKIVHFEVMNAQTNYCPKSKKYLL